MTIKGGVPKAAKADFDMTYWCSHGAGNSQICLWPPNDGSISVYGLSTDEVQLVLQVHNECRKMLAEKYGAILSTMVCHLESKHYYTSVTNQGYISTFLSTIM